MAGPQRPAMFIYEGVDEMELGPAGERPAEDDGGRALVDPDLDHALGAGSQLAEYCCLAFCVHWPRRNQTSGQGDGPKPPSVTELTGCSRTDRLGQRHPVAR